MKQILYFLFITIGFGSCTDNKSSKNIMEKKTVESIEKVSTNETDTEIEVSYKTLNSLLESKQPITKKYFVDSEIRINGFLYNHSILQKSDKYVIIRSTDNGTFVKNYYLLSFSKNTGKLISFVEIGQETEGVEPYKISWKSDIAFSTVDFQYELLEDEESGAFIQGAVLDSTVRNYEVNTDGLITFQD